MKHNLFFLLTLLLCMNACKQVDKKSKELLDRTKAKSKELIDTALNKLSSTDDKPVFFSIRDIVTDFKGDNSIKELNGVQMDIYSLYVEYCVYTGKKERVLKGVNKIKAKKVGDISSDSECGTIDENDFFSNIALPEEMNRHNAFFWKFKQLKKYDVYTCTKAPLRHYIIFDRKSDTVYHRIEELAN
jgi:hypothetical protein